MFKALSGSELCQNATVFMLLFGEIKKIKKSFFYSDGVAIFQKKNQLLFVTYFRSNCIIDTNQFAAKNILMTLAPCHAFSNFLFYFLLLTV